MTHDRLNYRSRWEWCSKVEKADTGSSFQQSHPQKGKLEIGYSRVEGAGLLLGSALDVDLVSVVVVVSLGFVELVEAVELEADELESLM